MGSELYGRSDLAYDGLLLYRRIHDGCGNNGCVIGKPVVGTNGKCRCTPREFAMELRDIAGAMEVGHGHGSWKDA